MKTTEINHGNNWLDKLLNSWPFLLDTTKIKPLFAFAYCTKTGEYLFETGDFEESLYRNGRIFFRIMLPGFIGIGFRVGKYTVHSYIGWKLNGRFGLVPLRIQTDKSSAEGTHGPNHGQETGTECGNK